MSIDFGTTPATSPATGSPCYLTVVEAAEIAATLPPAQTAAYLAAGGNAAKLALLVAATADVDAMRFQGRKYDPTQGLEFPRVAHETARSMVAGGQHGRPTAVRSGDVVWDWPADESAPIVPHAVKVAVVHQANALADPDREGRLDAMHDGLASQSAGGMSESYREPPKAGGVQLCRRAALLLERYRLKGAVIL